MKTNHEIFSALGDPVRFAIIDKLMRDGDQTAGALNALADISAPAFSRHLKVLREAGLVQQRKEGQSRIYSAERDVVEAIGDWSISYRKFWNESLDRLEEALQRSWPS